MLASVTNSLHSYLDSPPVLFAVAMASPLAPPQAAELVADNIETYCSTLTEVRDHLEALLKVRMCAKSSLCVCVCVCMRACVCVWCMCVYCACMHTVCKQSVCHH